MAHPLDYKPAVTGVEPAIVASTGECDGCPLCHRAMRVRTGKPLYGVKVCKKCYYGFINKRQVAFVIDWLLWVVVVSAVVTGATVGWFMYVQQGTGVSSGAAAIVEWSAAMAVYVIFRVMFLLKDGFRGYSPGKRLCGVKVVDRRTRKPIGFGCSLKRNLTFLVPFAKFIIAFLMGKGERIGDRWARSRVIWNKYEHHSVFGGGLKCDWCRYDLTGNVSGACPECGAGVSPANQAW